MFASLSTQPHRSQLVCLSITATLLALSGCAATQTQSAGLSEDMALESQRKPTTAKTSQVKHLCTIVVQGIETHSDKTEKECADAGGHIKGSAELKTVDAQCDGSRQVLFSLDGAHQIACEQGFLQGTLKYEISSFLPASHLDDELIVMHRKLVDPEYYYPHQNISVREQLRSNFDEFQANTFSKDSTVRTGFASSFKVSRFTHEEKWCFGFTKHTRQSLSLGYFCRPHGDDYSAEQLQERLSGLSFR